MGKVVEKLGRCLKTVFFMVAMLVSLLVSSLPVLVAIGDVLVPTFLLSSFTCLTCYSFKEHLSRYSFKSSLTDIPLVSLVRSFLVICTFRRPSFLSQFFHFLESQSMYFYFMNRCIFTLRWGCTLSRTLPRNCVLVFRCFHCSSFG